MDHLLRLLGSVLLAGGAYTLGHAMLPRWHRPAEAAAAEPGAADRTSPDDRALRLRAALEERRRARELALLRLAWAALIGGALLLAAGWPGMRPSASTPQRDAAAAPPASAAAGLAAETVGDASKARSNAIDTLFWISALLIATGGALALLARQTSVRVAGIASIAAGAIAHGSVIGKVKKLFALDLGGVDLGGLEIQLRGELKAELKAELRREIEALSRFRPQYLGGVQGFALGRASLDAEGFGGDAAALASAELELRRICAAWEAQGARSDTLILIVGGTDRLALSGGVRGRYEANTGLAQARAASVKSDLEKRCLPPLASTRERLLLLASGPATTPRATTAEERRVGHPQDRRADVWVLSTISPGPAPPR